MQDVQRILPQIKNRIRHVRTIKHRAVNILLDRSEQADTDILSEITVYDLEQHVPSWQFLIPNSPEKNAQLIHQISQNYPLNVDRFPKTAAALGIQDEEINSAHQQQFGDLKLADESEIPAAMTEGLSEAERDLLNELEWHYLRRGEVLYKQGEQGEHVYVMVNGSLQVTLAWHEGSPLTSVIQNSTIVGEEGVAADVPYATTVTALRDSNLVRLHLLGFERLAAKYPRSMVQLALRLMKRSQEFSGSATTQPQPQSVVVFHVTDGTSDFSPSLANTLGEYQNKETLILNPNQLDAYMSADLHVQLETIVDEYVFVDWLQERQRQVDMILFEGDLRFPNWTRRAVEQADHILVVGHVGESFDFGAWQSILDQMSHPELQPKKHLIMLHPTRNRGYYGTHSWIKQVGDVVAHHVALDTDKGFERIVRFLLGKAIGVVFGGGGMRGACHLGVIQALNERGIYADMVGGTSAGSIVAAQYAAGWDVDEILKRTKEDLMRRDVMINITFPIVAVNTGKKLVEVYRDWFGETQSEDLWTTCFTISGNMTLTKQSVNYYGPLWQNVRYSTSIAGLYPPIPDRDGYLHIDGGVYNNTPSDIMREFVGSGTVIASDLGYTQREPVQYNYGPYLNGWKVLWSWINPFQESMKILDISAVLMQSNALAARGITSFQLAASDLVIKPEVGGVGLFDFDAADMLYQSGYEAATEALADFSVK
jgi:NTE family protein